jgi:hypothetical protein
LNIYRISLDPIHITDLPAIFISNISYKLIYGSAYLLNGERLLRKIVVPAGAPIVLIPERDEVRESYKVSVYQYLSGGFYLTINGITQ